MSARRKLVDRLHLSAFKAQPADALWAVIGGLIGAGVGWLMVGMWFAR